MVFRPPQFESPSEELDRHVIRAHPFATLVTASDAGLQFSQAPLYLSDCGQHLIGHLARANPHGDVLTDGRESTAIFHGPHHYISPAWYEPSPTNVPTWNYVTIYVQITAEEVTGPDEIVRLLGKMSEMEEKLIATNWRLPQDTEAITGMTKGIRFFKFPIKAITGKYKLSQNQPSPNRDAVVAGLKAIGTDLAGTTAAYMQKV